MTEQFLHLFHNYKKKKKRQGWSNYRIFRQFFFARGQERLDRNTAEAVPGSPLAEGSQQGFIHHCKWVVPCERASTMQRRMLQEDGRRPLSVTSSLSCWLPLCPLSRLHVFHGWSLIVLVICWVPSGRSGLETPGC